MKLASTLRAAARQTERFLGAPGATPVPQVGNALSKGVIDGAVVPFEVVPSVKIQQFVKFHSETDPAEPAFYTATFRFVMNKARCDGLSPELKQMIDANSGQALADQIGQGFLAADGEGRTLTTNRTTKVIPAAEPANWKRVRPAADRQLGGRDERQGLQGPAVARQRLRTDRQARRGEVSVGCGGYRVRGASSGCPCAAPLAGLSAILVAPAR